MDAEGVRALARLLRDVLGHEARVPGPPGVAAVVGQPHAALLVRCAVLAEHRDPHLLRVLRVDDDARDVARV